MRAITTETKVLVGRLGPVAVKALELAASATVRAGGPEITTDHLLRALLDLPDSDLGVAMTAAGISRVDVGARLDWHLKRLPSGHKGKPSFAPSLLLLLQDAAALTTDPVRTGHLVAALLADPSLSAADAVVPLKTLPREPRHLHASRYEDKGVVGRVLGAPGTAAPAVPAAETLQVTEPAEAKSEAKAEAREIKIAPVEAPKASAAEAPKASPAGEAKISLLPDDAKAPPAAPVAPAEPIKASPPRPAPKNLSVIKARFADRTVREDASGLTLLARVGDRDTALRIAWDTEARVLVLRIALPADPPSDEVSASVALSTLNNALPHGAFVLDDGRLAFRSHVFLDAEGNAPVETVAFAVRQCEQAAEALGDGEG